MNLQEANLQNLLETRFTHDAEERLLKAIDTGDDRFLARMLRDYRQNAVSDPAEIRFRAAVDRFLSFCGVLEIAAMSGFIALPSDLTLKARFETILENAHLRQYYEDFYPTPLPQLLRLRLEGTNLTVRNVSPSVTLAFIQLDNEFSEHLEDSVLLRMLDGFAVGGIRFPQVIDLIKDPTRFMDAILVAPKERDIPGRALQDFSALMQFCFDLDALLSQRIDDELFRSAVWYQYGYWFKILGTEFRVTLGNAVRKFLTWDIKALGGDQAAASAVQRYVQDATGVLETLTSQELAEPIDSLLKDLKPDGPHLGMYH